MTKEFHELPNEQRLSRCTADNLAVENEYLKIQNASLRLALKDQRQKWVEFFETEHTLKQDLIGKIAVKKIDIALELK